MERKPRHRLAFLASPAMIGVLAALVMLLPATGAHADWRDEMKVFRIGMIARDSSGQAVPGLAVIKRAYTQALGLPVEIFVARDYAALIDAQATARVDYAIYSTTAYATASLLCSCVEPVVSPVGADGATGLMAVLITRDKRLKTLDDMEAHRIALPPGDLAGLALANLSDGKIFDGSEPFFVPAASASDAEALLVDGSVDVVLGWVPVGADKDATLSGGTLERLAAAGLDGEALSVVWSSPVLRYGPHTLRLGFNGEVRKILLRFLTGLADFQPDLYEVIETERGGGLVEVTSDDYAAAVDMVRRIGAEPTDP